MPIDLTDRIIQSPSPPRKVVKLHPLRRVVQVICGVLLVVLPMTDLMRVDVRLGKFWFLNQSYTAQNLFLTFWAGSIIVIVVFGVSVMYGRWWCGWVCPQTLLSDFGDSTLQRIKKLFRARSGNWQATVSQTIWVASMIVIAIATAAVILSFLFAPVTVWHAAFAPLFDPTLALGIYLTAAVTAADLIMVRRKFCSTACPYGLFLSLLGDRNTMTVRYLDERNDDCIKCGNCVTLCPMGIDIKEGANQMACIGCGECIDACNDVLPMLKKNPKAGLIELRYGLNPTRTSDSLTLPQRLGIWDGRRVLVLVTVLVLCVGLLFELYGTHSSNISVTPLGNITVGSKSIAETYQVSLLNGDTHDTQYTFALQGLSKATIVEPDAPVPVAHGAEVTITLVVAAPAQAYMAGQRYPMTIIATPLGERVRYTAEAIYYVPAANAVKENN